MNKPSKLMKLIVGASAVAAMGVAMAQTERPHAEIANPALGAGQQSVHNTPMGETGVSQAADPTLVVVPVAVVEPAPTVVVVPAAPPSSTMGAGPSATQPMVQPPMEPQRSESAPMMEPRTPRY